MRNRIRTAALPLHHTSFGPMRFLDALPWLVLAAAMRVIAFGGGVVALPAIFVASVAVLQAFIAVTKRSIELSGGSTGLDGLVLREEFQLSLAILWRVGLLMLAATLVASYLASYSVGMFMLGGLDGMAFDQAHAIGKIWSPCVATLVLLMIVGAESHAGKVSLRDAARECLARWRWLGVAIAALALAYVVLSFGQGIVRGAIWSFGQDPAVSPFTRNLVFFVFIFSFAMLRLWVTLLILT